MSNQILISSGAKLRDLDDVIIGTDGVLSSLGFDVPYGVPRLDANGKILVSELPNSVMEFKGVWNAATNTPTLTNGVGNAGDVYLCNVAGTVNFGAGPITFAVGDYAVYTGSVWARSSGAVGTVTSVAVSRDGDALAITGSPITSSGTINIGFTGNSTQYINGAGNLVTFPTIISEAQNLVTEVYNETGATLTKGTIVYINGGHGNLPTVTKAIATSDATSAQTYGVVRADITNMNNGYVTVIGSLNDLDTSAYTAGTQLYLSGTTAGAWTSTKPQAPVHLVYVGIVVRSHPTQGVVEIRIQNGYELEELHNVQIISPANGNILQYDSATSLWKNVAGTTTNIAEGTNLYFTNARARNAISLTTLGSTGPATYDSATGILNIPNYVDQYVGTVTSVGLSAPTGFSVSGSPVTSSGTLALSFASGYSLPTTLKQSNWDDAYTWVAAFPTQTGNAGKFLTTDGSTLSWATNPLGTVTSVAMTVPTGLSVAGSPITTSGTLAVTFAAGYSIPTNASQTNWDTAYTNRITSLTTTGSSGSATLVSNTLNIPTYTLSGLGGVPTSRTLTINGVTYDLSADRTWTVTAGISSVSGTAPISVSTVAGAATVSIATANSTTTGALTSTDWNTFNNKQNALTNPVTGTGTLNYVPKFTATGSTIGDSTISDDGTVITLANSVTITQGLRINGTQLNFYGATSEIVARTSPYLDLYTNGTTLALRLASSDASAKFLGNVLIGNAANTSQLNIFGDTQPTITFQNSGANRGQISANSSNLIYNSLTGNGHVFQIDSVTKFSIASSGAATFVSSVTTNNGIISNFGRMNGRFFVTNESDYGDMTSTSGMVSIGYYPAGQEATIRSRNYTTSTNTKLTFDASLFSFQNGNFAIGSTVANRQFVVSNGGAQGVEIGLSGGGYYSIISYNRATSTWLPLVLQEGSSPVYVNTVTGITGGGQLQVNGNVNINGVFQINGVTIGGGGGSGVSGSGTSSYIPRWTSSSSLGNSIIYDNGTNIGIGTTSTTGRVTISPPTNNSTSSIEFTNADNAAITAYYSLTFGVDNSNTVGGRVIQFTKGGKGYGNMASVMMLINADTGSVGIGTTSPNRKFVVSNGGADGIELNPYGTYASILTYNRATSTYINLYLGESTSKVIIGPTYTDNGSKLQVYGDLYVSGTAVYAGGVSYSGVQTFNNTVNLNSNTNVAVYQNIVWKGTTSASDFSMGNGGAGMYILSSAAIDLNAPIVQRNGLGYSFAGTSSSYNVLLLNSGTSIDEITVLGGVRLTTTTAGLIPPRMTTTQLNALSARGATYCPNGTTVFDTTINILRTWNGSAWMNLW